MSVLTGDGKPATDWMRFAKIRSTRSKLRSYFRRKQRQSLRDAGAILLMDFLKMYGDIIKEESHLEEPFEIPKTIEEMSLFLPGKSSYHEVDDLLIDIGGIHDRSFLRTAMAKIFQVAQRHIIDAENNRSQELSNQMIEFIYAKRKSALDVSVALDQEDGNILNFSYDDIADHKVNGDAEAKMVNGTSTKSLRIKKWKKSKESSNKLERNSFVNTSTEIADPDHVCASCLPVFGDEIVGTRPTGISKDDIMTTVHRSSCGIVLKARNDIMTKQCEADVNTEEKLLVGNTDEKQDVNSERSNLLEIVDLVWDESYTEGENILYMAEIRLICNDRKLLLADCSEVVSDMSEIVKTGSLSTEEHAILNFLVKVKSLMHLQRLMNTLRDIPSVMSVERNVSVKTILKKFPSYFSLSKQDFVFHHSSVWF